MIPLKESGKWLLIIMVILVISLTCYALYATGDKETELQCQDTTQEKDYSKTTSWKTSQAVIWTMGSRMREKIVLESPDGMLTDKHMDAAVDF